MDRDEVRLLGDRRGPDHRALRRSAGTQCRLRPGGSRAYPRRQRARSAAAGHQLRSCLLTQRGDEHRGQGRRVPRGVPGVEAGRAAGAAARQCRPECAGRVLSRGLGVGAGKQFPCDPGRNPPRPRRRRVRDRDVSRDGGRRGSGGRGAAQLGDRGTAAARPACRFAPAMVCKCRSTACVPAKTDGCARCRSSPESLAEGGRSNSTADRHSRHGGAWPGHDDWCISNLAAMAVETVGNSEQVASNRRAGGVEWLRPRRPLQPRRRSRLRLRRRFRRRQRRRLPRRTLRRSAHLRARAARGRMDWCRQSTSGAKQ